MEVGDEIERNDLCMAETVIFQFTDVRVAGRLQKGVIGDGIGFILFLKDSDTLLVVSICPGDLRGGCIRRVG